MTAARGRAAAAAAPALPDKPFFKIGEAARLVGVKPYVLRFWETEFPTVRPQKSRSGQRVYSRRNVETLLAIRRLVHGEGYTLAGARKRLREIGSDGVTETAHAGPEAAPIDLDSARGRARLRKTLDGLRAEVEALVRLVDRDEAASSG